MAPRLIISITNQLQSWIFYSWFLISAINSDSWYTLCYMLLPISLFGIANSVCIRSHTSVITLLGFVVSSFKVASKILHISLVPGMTKNHYMWSCHSTNSCNKRLIILHSCLSLVMKTMFWLCFLNWFLKNSDLRIQQIFYWNLSMHYYYCIIQ